MAAGNFLAAPRSNGGRLFLPPEEYCMPEWDCCVFAFTGAGANGAQPSTDLTGKTLTWNGGALSTAQSLFYGSSLLCSSGTQYFSVADASIPALLDYDFTMRLRFWPSTSGATYQMLRKHDTNQNLEFVLGTSGTSAYFAASSSVGGGWNVCEIIAGTVTAGAWNTLEINRIKDLFLLSLGGVVVGSATSSASLLNTTQPWLFGTPDQGSGTACYLQDIEIFHGVSLHNSSFIPSSRDLLSRARRYAPIIGQL